MTWTPSRKAVNKALATFLSGIDAEKSAMRRALLAAYRVDHPPLSWKAQRMIRQGIADVKAGRVVKARPVDFGEAPHRRGRR